MVLLPPAAASAGAEDGGGGGGDGRVLACDLRYLEPAVERKECTGEVVLPRVGRDRLGLRTCARCVRYASPN